MMEVGSIASKIDMEAKVILRCLSMAVYRDIVRAPWIIKPKKSR